MTSSTNITWHESTVGQNDRWKLAGHRGAVVWFTGLSGAGKSSVANAVESALNRDHKVRTYLLDGDNIRYVRSDLVSVLRMLACFDSMYSYMK
jgi:adenylylsulfate kinase